MILILLGPPGAGKGTQAKMLATAFSVPHISTGDMFREQAALGTALGKKVAEVLASGSLVTDDLTNAMVDDRMGRPDVVGGCIMDGYPRTISQAEHLSKLLGRQAKSIAVVSYTVSEEEVVARIGGRRTCPLCGTVYHLTAHPPRVAGRCDEDGAPLMVREDDKPDSVKHRMRVYTRKTAPVVAYYREPRP